jgi:hypothetical protein
MSTKGDEKSTNIPNDIRLPYDRNEKQPENIALLLSLPVLGGGSEIKLYYLTIF